MFARRADFKRFRCEVLVTALRLCAACPFPAVSEPVPIWTAFTSENSDLPNSRVPALAPGAGGALWIGTDGGLARLDKDGRWQTYSKASTRGHPGDRVTALAPCRSANAQLCRAAPSRRRFRSRGRPPRPERQRPDLIIRQAALGASPTVGLPAPIFVEPRQAAIVCPDPESPVRAERERPDVIIRQPALSVCRGV